VLLGAHPRAHRDAERSAENQLFVMAGVIPAMTKAGASSRALSRSGRAHGAEELADFGLEPVAVA
jgi:hypothetical protein